MNTTPRPQGCANTSTGLRQTYFHRAEAVIAAGYSGRRVLWSQMWVGQELVSVYYVH